MIRLSVVCALIVIALAGLTTLVKVFCPTNDRNRRISPVTAHSGDRLVSEPTAGTQPCRREPLFMPQGVPM
jgi:hypothetical protein